LETILFFGALMTIHEPIDMTSRDNNYFPKAFLWRGRRYNVDAVEQCWTVARRHWMGRIERHGFRVRTSHATYVLYHDISRNSWYMERTVGAR